MKRAEPIMTGPSTDQSLQEKMNAVVERHRGTVAKLANEFNKPLTAEQLAELVGKRIEARRQQDQEFLSEYRSRHIVEPKSSL